MNYVVYAMIAVMIGFVIFMGAKMIQLGRFSDYIGRDLDRVRDARIELIREGGNYNSVPWPKVQESYSNLDRSRPWNYNFSEMVVYETVD